MKNIIKKQTKFWYGALLADLPSAFTFPGIFNTCFGLPPWSGYECPKQTQIQEACHIMPFCADPHHEKNPIIYVANIL